jgi:tetratricopeptide (TPR) repeat protein
VDKIVLDKFYEVAKREGVFELKEFKILRNLIIYFLVGVAIGNLVLYFLLPMFWTYIFNGIYIGFIGPIIFYRSLPISLLRGFERVKKNNYEKAIKIFSHITKRRPHNLRATYGLALSYGFLKQDEKSIKCYHDVLKIEPHHWSSLFSLARIYERNGDLAHAKMYAQKALEVDPKSEVVLKFLDDLDSGN